MIDSGSLNDRIRFMEAVVGKGSYGDRVITGWNPVYSCWAKVTYNKGNRAISAGEVWLPNTISVLLRYNSKVNERHRVVWDGKTYRIDSLNASKKDGSITIVATRVDEGTGEEE
jgi:SPP1 family predicted phage head-tail adaptor|nr:MAG TPA: Putative head tail adaptor [Caudoviricetes sp.]